jgi:hypothetical protein
VERGLSCLISNSLAQESGNEIVDLCLAKQFPFCFPHVLPYPWSESGLAEDMLVDHQQVLSSK